MTPKTGARDSGVTFHDTLFAKAHIVYLKIPVVNNILFALLNMVKIY